jgi:uncharacterized membrane protein (UPF0127 family)
MAAKSEVDAHTFTLRHQPTGRTIATVRRLDGWLAKGIGVIGRAGMAAGTGVWLPGVASVHTCFVRFSLDLLFLDREFRLLKAVPAVHPWRLLVTCPGAWHTIEMGEGSLLDDVLKPGDLYYAKSTGL